MPGTPHTDPTGIDGGPLSEKEPKGKKKQKQKPTNQRRNPQEKTHGKKSELPLIPKPDGLTYTCKFWPLSSGQYISFSISQLKWWITSVTLITSALFTQHFFLTISVAFPSEIQPDANSALFTMAVQAHLLPARPIINEIPFPQESPYKLKIKWYQKCVYCKI